MRKNLHWEWLHLEKHTYLHMINKRPMGLSVFPFKITPVQKSSLKIHFYFFFVNPPSLPSDLLQSWFFCIRISKESLSNVFPWTPSPNNWKETSTSKTKSPTTSISTRGKNMFDYTVDHLGEVAQLFSPKRSAWPSCCPSPPPRSPASSSPSSPPPSPSCSRSSCSSSGCPRWSPPTPGSQDRTRPFCSERTSLMLKTENYSLVLLLILKISKIIALFHPIAVPRVMTLMWLLQNWADPNQGSNLWCTSVLVLLWLSPSPSSHMGGVLFQWHVRDQSFVGCFKISIIVVLFIHGIILIEWPLIPE